MAWCYDPTNSIVLLAGVNDAMTKRVNWTTSFPCRSKKVKFYSNYNGNTDIPNAGAPDATDFGHIKYRME